MTRVVTIVTLTYKRFDLLFNAIDSVIMQDYPQIEYIISDDGSPDFPKEEILKYIDKKRRSGLLNVKVLANKHNLGTVRNINQAYRQASGDIIIPLSADDAFFDSTVVSKIVNTYEKRSCNALIVGRAVFDNENNFVKNIPNRSERKILERYRDNKYQYQLFITGCSFEAYSGSVLSFRKQFIENWGYFDEQYTLWEDGPFFAKYLWENYLECNFDLIGLKYRNDGVSGKNKHPKLIKDDEQFIKTDKIAHINELPFIKRDIVKFSVGIHSSDSKWKYIEAFIKHPLGFFAKLFYCIRSKI